MGTAYTAVARDAGLSHIDYLLTTHFHADHDGGVAELAQAIGAHRSPRASGDLMYHVLDIMHAVHDSSSGEHHLHLESGCLHPEPFELDQLLGSSR
jgi:beta-lactamase superfamily II metal-dependent hydrolase